MIGIMPTWCTYYSGAVDVWPEELLDINIISGEYRRRPFFAYPMPNGHFRQFADIQEWYQYVKSFRLVPGKIVLPYLDAFDEALRALFMTYLFGEFCKMGEMKAFATLEGALLTAYAHKMCKEAKNGRHRCAGLGETLKWAEENDGLRPGLFDVSKLQRSPSALNVIRDRQMHGYLFEETLPWGGLFELIKETIEYAYRNHPPYDIHNQRHVYGNQFANIEGNSGSPLW